MRPKSCLTSRLASIALSWLALSTCTAGPAFAEPLTMAGRILDAQGKPLAGATVEILPISTHYDQGLKALQDKLDPDPAATAASDAAGRFRLTVSGAGPWRVRVRAAGFVPREYPVFPLLEAAELPDVRLEPGTPLKVQVLDPQGLPLAGARVLGTPGLGASHRFEELPRFSPWQAADRAGLSGPDGAVTLLRGPEEVLALRALAPGHSEGEATVSGPAAASPVQIRLPRGCEVTVEVTERAGQPAAAAFVEADGWAAGVTDDAGRLTVATPCGQETWIRAGLRDGRESQAVLDARRAPGKPVRLALPARPLRITGRVLEKGTRQPVAGALIWGNTDPGRAVWTGRDGAYSVVVQADDHLRLDVVSSHHFPDSVEHRTASGGSGQGDQEGPAIVLAPLVVAAGTVVDEAGRPVRDADVVAWLADAEPFAPFTSNQTRSEARGTFRLHLSPGKPYDVEVKHPGFAPARVPLSGIALGTAPPPDLRVVLQKGRKAVGTVLDSRENPVAGARIALISLGQPEALMIEFFAGGFDPDFVATSGADGRFSFDHLPPGRFHLQAHAAGFGPVTVPGLEIPAGASPVQLGTVILPPGVELAGVVVDAKGEPVAGAEVSLSGDFSSLSFRSMAEERVTTGADGRFVFSGIGTREQRAVTVDREGYVSRTVSGIELPLARPLRVVLAPGTRVAGRVVDERGQPVDFASVTLSRSGSVGFDIPQGTTSTDESGRFEVKNLEAGTLTLRAEAEGLRPTEIANLQVDAEKGLDNLEVVLRAGAIVTGQVVGADGHPVAGAYVTLEGDSRVVGSTAVSEGNGKYRLEGLEPGPRVVSATHPEHQRSARELDVQPGENRLDFRLGAGHTVAGRVVDAAGRPFEGAEVGLRGTAGYTPGARSAADGTFRFTNVAAGSYQLSAESPGHATGRLTGLQVTGDVDGLEIRLERGGVIRGRILGLELPQLSQVAVVAHRPDRSAAGGFAQVDFRGEYRIESLPAGEWQVVAALVEGGRKAEGKVTLEADGEAVLDLELGEKGGLTLSGRVLRRGEPVDGVMILAQNTGSNGHATSNQEGVFRISGLEPGTYQVNVMDFRRGFSPPRTVELTADQDIVIELPESRLSGRVVDAADSSPIEGATVSLEPVAPSQGPGLIPGGWKATSDTAGAFTLVDVEEGSFRLVARKEGYGPGETGVQVEAGASLDGLRIALSPTQGLVLQVTGPTGLPPSVRVALHDATGRAILAGSYPVVEGGRVRLSDAPPGRWSLLVAAGDTATTAMEVTVPGPATPVALPPAVPLSVTVPDLVDSDLAATLTVLGADGRPYREINWLSSQSRQWPLQDGRVRLTVPPGAWQLTVTAADGRRFQGTAAATPGTPAEVTLR